MGETIPDPDLDAEYEAEQIDCPECSTVVAPADLCECESPTCVPCHYRCHADDEDDRFREWVREGWAS